MSMLSHEQIAVPRNPLMSGMSSAETSSYRDPLDAEEAAQWDAWVQSHRTSTVFHTASWARVLFETYGYRPFYSATEDDSGDRALVPMMEVRSVLTGTRGVSLPFTDECGPLCESETSHADTVQRALDLGRDRGWKTLEFRGSIGTDTPASESFYGHRLALDAGEEALWSGLSSNTRRNVRKAIKEGVEIEQVTSAEGMRTYYDLHCTTRKRQGVPPQPLAFFMNIQKHLLEERLGFILIARSDGQPVAGAVYLTHGTQAIYKFGASDYRHQNLRANVLVMWEAIKRLAADGVETFSFGRTDIPHDGLRRFKLGFGAEEYPIHYHRLDVKSGEFAEDVATASGRMEGVFRTFPVPVLRAIGSALYRHMG